MDLKELLAEFQKTAEELKGQLDKQAEEIKTQGETSAKTAKSIEELDKRIVELNNEIIELQKASQRPFYGGEPVKSIGQQFVESEQYKSMISRDAKSSDSFMVKGLTSDPASAGVLVEPYRYPQIIGPQDRPLRIRDLLPVATTTSNAIEYVEETGFTNLAGTSTQGAADVVPEGELKPESNLTFDLKTESVKTIAHWIPATRQIIADAAQLRSYIDQRLVYGLKLKEESKLLYGSGTGGDIQGIMTHPGIQTYNWSAGQVGDTKIDAVRRAITKARLAEYPVTGIVMNPQDWEDIELAKGDDGRYIWVTVTEGGQQRLWRVPVVDTTAIQTGECLLGAFQMGGMIWDREQASIRVAEQHEDFFIRNMLLVLCEERLAFTIFRPEAFVAVEFDNAPANP
ncbi:MAG TPA: phage major capsid protein [Bacillota bacterium]|nr:phage major capsid protein [Bacillota bacterium]